MSMLAVRQTTWGGPEELHLVEVDRPDPLPTEVLIRVVAAGVNPVDVFTREGKAYQVALSLPFVPGWDVAGVVEEVGYGVTRFRRGDEVFGMPWFPREAGAYAEYITAPARHLALKPPSLTFAEAAALPLAGLTAWQMLVDVAQVTSGQRVLVNGASGGVGHLAVQVAKHLGATVVATASAGKHDFVRSLGADEVIDYAAGDVSDATTPVDVVIELVGGEVCLRMLDALAPGGLLVSAQAAWAPGLTRAARDRGLRATWYLVDPDPQGLGALAGLVGSDRLRVHVDSSLPLASAAAAQQKVADRAILGKLVLDVGTPTGHEP